MLTRFGRLVNSRQRLRNATKKFGYETLEARRLLASTPFISELMAVNAGTLADQDGEFSDWLEIHNPGDVEINLEGWFLSNAADNLDQWQFPSFVIEARTSRLVFASGKDIRSGEELHANFSLAKDGEFLALADPNTTVVHQFAPFPSQIADVSYGVDEAVFAQRYFFKSPTPGSQNDLTSRFVGLTPEPTFSVESGFYASTFTLEIIGPPEATLRYTLDSSAPTASSAIYGGPLTIDSTTIVRAAATQPDFLTVGDAARSYIFLDNVLEQDGAGLPATWGRFVNNSPLGVYRSGDAVPANYEMDPNVVNDPRYADTIRDDLLAIPSLSLVFDPADIWSDSTGLYSNTTAAGLSWERPVTAELIGIDGHIEFRVDAGARIHGGFSRFPNASAKHSIRLLFKNSYGPSKLNYPWFGDQAADEFDTIVLRAGYNFSWARGERNNTQHSADATFVLDRWASVLQNEMGGLAPHGTWVNLYINGLYWGLYNPNERPSAPFQASYQGGSSDEYDVLKIGEVVDGDRTAWNQLLTTVRQNPLDYETVKRQLDVPGFIDYLIINHFGGNEDWPHNNWYASRRRVEDAQWQFHSWDAEFLLRTPTLNRVLAGGNDGPGEIYLELRGSEEFRVDFADRVHKHFFNQGLLTPAANIARLDAVAAPIDRAIVGESARWGDSLFDNIKPARTRDDHWIPRLDELKTNVLPQRTDIVLQQYVNAGMYPSVVAPVFNQHGGAFDPGFELTISAGNGSVYFTLDGSDPRLPGGSLNPLAVEYDGPITLLDSQVIRTRTQDAAGKWSALNEATFVRNENVLVRISEIMYHPSPPAAGIPFDLDAFEFVEFMNIGNESLNPVGVSFVDGIEFTFPQMTIEPGQRVVAVKNLEAFQTRYGTEPIIAGEFTAGSLSNGGERLTLVDGLGNFIHDFSYDDGSPWPERADGMGASLEVIDPSGAGQSEYGTFRHWRGSTEFGGTPGFAGSGPFGVVINEVLARSDSSTGTVDAIEIHNTTDQAVNLGGWYLSDSGLDLLKFAIPQGTILAPHEFLLLDENDFNPAPRTPSNFALNGFAGDEVWLTITDGQGGILSFVDDVHFGAAAENETWGRTREPEGVGRMTPLSRNTLGCENGHARVGPLVISEIHYSPGPPSVDALAMDAGVTSADLEFVEILNPTSNAIDVIGWRIRGGVDMDFDEILVIVPQGTLVVVSFDTDDAANSARFDAFRAHFGVEANVPIVGGYDGQLSDLGERLELLRLADESGAPVDRPLLTEDRFVYEIGAPWPASGNGDGNSLHRVTPTSFGDDGKRWSSGEPTPGAVDYSTIATADFTGDGTVDAEDIDAMFDAVRADSRVTSYDLDGSGEVDEADIAFLLAEVGQTAAGDANLDGVVDAVDLAVWNEHRFSQCRTWATGDFNGDGSTDGSDFNIWNTNRFGQAAVTRGTARHPRAPLRIAVDPQFVDVAMLDFSTPNDVPLPQARSCVECADAKTSPADYGFRSFKTRFRGYRRLAALPPLAANDSELPAIETELRTHRVSWPNDSELGGSGDTA